MWKAEVNKVEVLVIISNGLLWILNQIMHFLGGFDGTISVLFDFMIVNMTILFVYSFQMKKGHRLKTMADSFVKKMITFAIIGVADSLDRLTGVGAIRHVVIYFFIVAEAAVILEYAVIFGVHIPKQIFSALNKLSDEVTNKTRDYENDVQDARNSLGSADTIKDIDKREKFDE